VAKKNQQPPPSDDDDDDVDFSPKQLEVINNTVSAAVSAMVGRKLKPLQDQLGELGSMRESIETLTKTLGGQGGQQQGQPGGAGGQQQSAAPKLEDHPEFIAMKKRDEAREAERKQERANARNAKRDQKLTEIATAAGVDKNRVRGVVALLRDQVKFDKDDNPIMSVKRNGYDEDVDLEAGAGEFFKSDEGKAYLAPQQPVRGGQQQRGTNAASVVRGQSGAGAAAGTNAPIRGKDEAKVERKQQAVATLADAVGQLLGGGNIEIG